MSGNSERQEQSPVRKTKKGKNHDIYRRIEHFMETRGISQAEFARTLGISTGNIGDWKRGKSAPGVGVLIDISKRYNISLDWQLLGKTDASNGVREEKGVYFLTTIGN